MEAKKKAFLFDKKFSKTYQKTYLTKKVIIFPFWKASWRQLPIGSGTDLKYLVAQGETNWVGRMAWKLSFATLQVKFGLDLVSSSKAKVLRTLKSVCRHFCNISWPLQLKIVFLWYEKNYFLISASHLIPNKYILFHWLIWSNLK